MNARMLVWVLAALCATACSGAKKSGLAPSAAPLATVPVEIVTVGACVDSRVERTTSLGAALTTGIISAGVEAAAAGLENAGKNSDSTSSASTSFLVKTGAGALFPQCLRYVRGDVYLHSSLYKDEFALPTNWLNEWDGATLQGLLNNDGIALAGAPEFYFEGEFLLANVSSPTKDGGFRTGPAVALAPLFVELGDPLANAFFAGGERIVNLDVTLKNVGVADDASGLVVPLGRLPGRQSIAYPVESRPHVLAAGVSNGERPRISQSAYAPLTLLRAPTGNAAADGASTDLVNTFRVDVTVKETRPRSPVMAFLGASVRASKDDIVTELSQDLVPSIEAEHKEELQDAADAAEAQRLADEAAFDAARVGACAAYNAARRADAAADALPDDTSTADRLQAIQAKENARASLIASISTLRAAAAKAGRRLSGWDYSALSSFLGSTPPDCIAIFE